MTTYARILSDPLGLADEMTPSTTSQHTVTITDLLGLTEAVFAGASYSRLISDALGLLDEKFYTSAGLYVPIRLVVTVRDRALVTQVLERALDVDVLERGMGTDVIEVIDIFTL